MDIIERAQKIFSKHNEPETRFERALFLSWYCSKGDCAFCYMSTQKNLIKDPARARRSLASIYAEAIISKACGWDIEFLSGGYESFSVEELVNIAETVSCITAKKQWLNIGTLRYKELELFRDSCAGYVGTLECVNPDIRNRICPSKPIADILDTFRSCDRLGLKKAVTVIIGLGETIDDFHHLESFIRMNGISKITFYSLNPQKGTPFTQSPSIDYYEKWIASTRIAFPEIHIVAGAWSDKIGYFSRLLLAGANNITKLPAIKMLGTSKGEAIEEQAKLAGRRFVGTFTEVPVVEPEPCIEQSLRDDVKSRISQYLAYNSEQ